MEFVGQPSSLKIRGKIVVAILSLKSIGQARNLETQAEFLCYSLEIEFLIFQETLVFALKAFNRLYEAHPHYKWQSPLCKVY